MKKTARILAVLMAILLGMAMMIPSFAAPNDDPAPSPGLPFEKGNLTVTKFLMPDLDLAGIPSNGGEIGDTSPNTGDSLAIIPPSATPIGGIDFKVYKIDFSSYTDTHGNLNNTPLDSLFRQLMDEFNKMGFKLNDYENPTYVESAQRDPANTPDGFKFPVTQVTDATPGVTGFTGTGTNSVLKTAADGTATVKNLVKGFYLVVEQLNNADTVASVSFPFIVSIPMTNATGTGWIQNVFAYPKNGSIKIDKEIDRNAVFVGEEVNFTVTVSVPADIRTYGEFYMTDIIDEALDLKLDSLKVHGLQTEAEASTAANEIKATGAAGDNGSTVAHTNFTTAQAATGTPAKNLFTVSFVKKPSTSGTPGPFGAPVSWNESREIDADGFWTLGEYKFVRFEFTCYVNDKILSLIGSDPSSGTDLNGDYPEGEQHYAYTAFNEAQINFKNKFDVDANKPARKRKSPTVRVHSAAILLTKQDANTKEALAGAEFKIASTMQNAKDGKFLKKVVTQFTAANGVVYKVGAILDAGKAADAAIIAGTLPANTADWMEKSEIYTAAQILAAFPNNAAYTALADKAIVCFQGLKEFGNWAALKGSTVDSADLEDLRKLPITFDPVGSPVAAADYLTYYIVETKTPSPDYNLLLEPIEVKFLPTTSKFANWYTVNGGIVNNTNKFTLPETGGVGTILFTAGGIALIVVAAFLFIMSARKKKVSEV